MNGAIPIPPRNSLRPGHVGRSAQREGQGDEFWSLAGPPDFNFQDPRQGCLYLEDFTDPNGYTQLYSNDFNPNMLFVDHHALSSSQGTDGSLSSSDNGHFNGTMASGLLSLPSAAVPRERGFEMSDIRRGGDMENENEPFDYYSSSDHASSNGHQYTSGSWNASSSADSGQGFVQPHATSATSSPFFDPTSPATDDMDSMPNSPNTTFGHLPDDGSRSFGSMPITITQPIATDAIRRASGRRRKYPVACHCMIPGCGQDFTTAFSRDRHMVSHRGIKPYPCRRQGCAQVFTHDSDRKRHEKSTRKHPGASR
jgi:hypothetical protein